jgi:hypothetical protein
MGRRAMSEIVIEILMDQKKSICGDIDRMIDICHERTKYETTIQHILEIIGDGEEVSKEEIMTIKRIAEDA